MRLIDADVLLRCVKIRHAWHKDYDVDEVIADIESQPTVDEFCDVKVGEWIPVEKPRLGNPYRHYKCSLCNNAVPYRRNFCDNCGARNIT